MHTINTNLNEQNIDFSNHPSHILLEKAYRQTAFNVPSLKPDEAFKLLTEYENALLIDVRTQAEIDWVGKPLINKQQYLHIEWLIYPGSMQNKQFMQAFSAISKTQVLLILCRSGIRSKMATEQLLANDFKWVIDIADGFEGQRDANGHRKTLNGWCFLNLPWVGA